MFEVNYTEAFLRVDTELKKKKLKREALAVACDCSDSSLSAWSKGTRTPSCTYMARIADFLGVSLEWLLFGKEEKQDELTKEERELVEAYRHLSSQGKVVVSFIAKGIRQD